MAEVLIISGASDYSDPWHRFGDTSLRLAEIIAGLGHQVTVSDAVEQALADPGEPDLIVVNPSDGSWETMRLRLRTPELVARCWSAEIWGQEAHTRSIASP